MTYLNGFTWSRHAEQDCPQTVQLSNYQLAVLSTLFLEEDCTKLEVLAQQWECSPEDLYAIWHEMHGSGFAADAEP